ncbi:MAG: RNase adapter RapZ [Sulfuricellaceae bacterium]|nr:RNase adapter RapZ [Sulfuricellaceae bacterium]
MKLLVVSGLSGSGKSIALQVLEDSDYYCVDNLPVKLLPEIVNYLQEMGHERVAVSIDVRGGEPLQDLPLQLEALQRRGLDVRVLFLETNNETLVKRYSETRRRHPLSKGQRTVTECIALERTLLDPLLPLAHRIDTSDLNPSVLRIWIKEFIQNDPARLTLIFQSFGFKHGLPLDSDFVFDVRCLPNPHWDTQLRPLTGQDAPVIAFLDGDESVQKMLADIRNFIAGWLPCFIRDNRHYLTVAIGCTGGRHRSVYLTENLVRHFRRDNPALVRHRELA